MVREWKTEWMKVRYRKIGLLLLAFLGFTFLWLAWIVRDARPEELEDGYRWMILNMGLINTILLPTMTAMLASRLCDTELKGNTLKLLFTMERKGRLFDMKLLMGACYLAAYMALEIGMLLLLGKALHFGQPLTLQKIGYFLIQNYLVTLAVFLFQEVLSFFFENQILPLAAGLFGSFVGLFSWFFPGAFFRRLLLWGYYCLLAFVNMYWNEDTRDMYFYDVPLDLTALAVLAAVLVLGYIFGKYLFVKREV